MIKVKKVNIREFQHNLSAYVALLKAGPLIITRNGKESAILADPNVYELKEKIATSKKKGIDVMSLAFFGMYKNRKDWNNKSPVKITDALRKKAWYGE